MTIEQWFLVFLTWIAVLALLAGAVVIRERRKDRELRQALDRLNSLGTVESHREVFGGQHDTRNR